MLGDSGGVSIGELSRRLLISKHSVRRLVTTLQEMGYVAERHDDSFALTIKLFELGAKVLPNLDLARLADAPMREIAESSRETVHLGARSGDQIVYMHTISSAYGLRMQSVIGSTNPLYSTAIGKALLAWSDAGEARAILSNVEFNHRTPHTLVSLEAVMDALPAIREQGFSEDNEEQEQGLRCIAAPVFDYTGAVVAALSISAPTTRFTDARREGHLASLREAARSISEQLGFRSYPMKGQA